MQKEVEVQFDDDRYLDVSRTQGKLIEGVKHQYQKMKLSTFGIIQSMKTSAESSMNF
jgi:hypothetical protein